ncbi:MAG: TetR/AcrR family transcriptional regulator [Bacteroidetes bacterium]|nr:TetR/AcrR family transcriptional regulator [Bacteroidota bacterium]MBL0096204.1 TetR/AcrR family transcriptional regulator [Bacteroidota bacterium]
MDFHVRFDISDKLYLRNPEGSELGKQIVQKAIILIFDIGFEQFTFKKLASESNCTEASIYRYFENKHRLLLYILSWYWNYMEFLVNFKIMNLNDSKEKLKVVIQLLTQDLSVEFGNIEYNTHYLNQIVIAESGKGYMIKDVSELNSNEVFKPYKDLCATIASIISVYNPNYEFPHSLSTTLIEASHQQQFFSKNLPRLTDVNTVKKSDFIKLFLEDMLFKILG